MNNKPDESNVKDLANIATGAALRPPQPEDIPEKEVIDEKLEFLEDEENTKDKELSLYMLGRFLEWIGQKIQDKLEVKAKQKLEENDGKISLPNYTISLRNYQSYDYYDEQLEKYKEKKKQLQKSIKNRKKQLREKQQAIPTKSTKSIQVR